MHATAGFCDPGWKGTLTLELNNLTRVPIKLYPGLPIAQLSFMTLDAPALRPTATSSSAATTRASSRPPRAGTGHAGPIPAPALAAVEDDGLAISYKLPRARHPGPQLRRRRLLGTVDRVLDNAREQIFDGIVMRTAAGERFVDAPEVARITEQRVTLSIDAAEAAALPEPEPGAPEYQRQVRARARRADARQRLEAPLTRTPSEPGT